MRFKRIAAAVLAAAATASASVCAYAQTAPFEWELENVKSADGYDKEKSAVLNFFGIDESQGVNAIDGILSDDSFITVDFGNNSIDEELLPVFYFYKFSEDGSTLEEKYAFGIHSHPATRDFAWDLDGKKGEPYTADGQQDGIDYNNSRCIVGHTTVLGNKISCGLMKVLYEENVSGAIDMGPDFYSDEEIEELKNLPSFDEYDVIMVGISNGDMFSSVIFLTESYTAANPPSPKPETSAEPETSAAPETSSVSETLAEPETSAEPETMSEPETSAASSELSSSVSSDVSDQGGSSTVWIIAGVAAGVVVIAGAAAGIIIFKKRK